MIRSYARRENKNKSIVAGLYSTEWPYRVLNKCQVTVYKQSYHMWEEDVVTEDEKRVVLILASLHSKRILTLSRTPTEDLPIVKGAIILPYGKVIF
jgi:hypothetical protein